MRNQNLLLAPLAVGLALTLAPASAAVIDFEGVAPSGALSTEDNTNNVFSGFNVFVPHGHYVDSLYPGANYVSNGTDWLIHDHVLPVLITQVGGGVFQLLSLDASEYFDLFTRPQTLTVTGHFQGGGTIVANLLTDTAFGFQTFNFGGAWINLVQIDIISTGGGLLGYDNVVVTPGRVVIPEPSTFALLGAGVCSLAALRRLRSYLKH